MDGRETGKWDKARDVKDLKSLPGKKETLELKQ